MLRTPFGKVFSEICAGDSKVAALNELFAFTVVGFGGAASFFVAGAAFKSGFESGAAIGGAASGAATVGGVTIEGAASCARAAEWEKSGAPQSRARRKYRFIEGQTVEKHRAKSGECGAHFLTIGRALTPSFNTEPCARFSIFRQTVKSGRIPQKMKRGTTVEAKIFAFDYARRGARFVHGESRQP